MESNIVMISVDALIGFSGHPYKVVDDAAMEELCESVRTAGVLVPIIVRIVEDGRYEIISGHRRKRACEREGIGTIPAVITKLSDDEAAILLVDSNLHRENILPSEKAYAYKLKLDAMKHQGKKKSGSFGQNVRNPEVTDEIGVDDKKSGRQIRRYIRLTELIYQLLDKVDMKLIPVMAGAELSYVDVRNQVIINDVLDCECCGLSLKQAIKLKRYYLDGNISEEIIADITLEKERNDNGKVILQYDRLRKYFPEHYTPKECEDALWKILEAWFKNM